MLLNLETTFQEKVSCNQVIYQAECLQHLSAKRPCFSQGSALMVASDGQSKIPQEVIYDGKVVQNFIPHLSRELVFSDPSVLWQGFAFAITSYQ